MQNPVPNETHHGVDFIDWAAANANLAFGKTVAEVVKTLGVEEPLWEAASEKWNERLVELMTENPEVASIYGEIFQNPAVGAFAKTQDSPGDSANTRLADIDLDKFAEIQAHVEVASEQGVDMQAVMRDAYGITVGEFAQLQMKFMQPPVAPTESTALRDYLTHIEAVKARVRPGFEAKYGGGEGAGLGDDIEF